MKQVLVTGSAGRIGQAVVRELVRQGHHVVGYDQRPTPGATHALVADLSDVAVLRAAARGLDCLIHLAATPDDRHYPRPAPPHDVDNFLTELVPNNIIGLYQVLEIARQVRLPRLILASTGQVVERTLIDQFPIRGSTPPTPRYLYASTKVWLEAIAQAYAREHQVPTLVVRLGWCPRDAGQVAQIAAHADHQDVYLSPGDAGRFFAAAVVSDRLPAFGIAFATSRPIHRVVFDLREARAWLGYEPQDHWPTGAAPDTASA